MKQARPDLLNVPIMSFFSLKREPFGDNIRPSELFELPGLRHVASIAEAVWLNKSHFAFTGPTGCGKSSIIRYICDRQERLGAKVVLLNGGDWGFGEFLRQIMGALNIDFRAYQPSTMIRLIQAQMAKLAEDGHTVMLVIDEADKLRNTAFYQLHLPITAPDQGQALATLIVCGQDSLADKLANPLAAPIKTRMYPGHYIPPINRQTYHDYVVHHMQLCGLRKDCVDDLALEHIWKATSGNLRSIGMTFRFALQYAANNNIPRIDAACAKAAFSDWWAMGQSFSPFAEQGGKDD